MVKIVVSGALGRMGKRIIALAEKDPGLKVVGKLEKDPPSGSGIVSDLKKIRGDYACLIDFTSPEGTIERVKEAKALKKAIVIGTTGFSKAEADIIKEASGSIPIVFSPNMSVGVNTFFSLIEKAARVLQKGYKVKIKEAHHIHKKDKPSGTAKLMKNIVKDKLGAVDVPVESIRENEIVGDHEIVFESDVDTLTISHSAKTRDIFAQGALKAAKFVATKKNGIFSMQDVMGV